MGRWGDGVYDSDSSADFLSTITDFLMMNTNHWFAPEQVYHSGRWLSNALTLVEIMIIFAEENHFGSKGHLLDQHTAVQRWHEVFFNVWDAEWDEPSEHHYPYSAYTYRVEQRRGVSALFSRLSEIADSWRDDLPKRDLQPFHLTLPLFSITRLRTREDREFFLVGQFFYELIEKLTHSIVFLLSEENREKEWGIEFYELEQVWVSVDIIGRMCEKYQITPALRPATVHRWLDITIGLWLDYYNGASEQVDIETLAEKSGLLYTNAVNVFVRLITVAQQYPNWMAL